jgi:hypothetical protein
VPVVRTHVFAMLTEAQALQLQGRQAQFLVELDSDLLEYEGQVLHDCAGLGELHHTLWQWGEVKEDLAELVTVEAMLVVLRPTPASPTPA